MCPVCPGESIDQSQNPLAGQMRKIVAEKLEKGHTPEDIKLFFVERYGNSILLSPPRHGIGLAAWVIPPIVLLVAVAAAFLALHSMRVKTPPEKDAPRNIIRLTPNEKDGYYRHIESALDLEISNPKPEKEPL